MIASDVPANETIQRESHVRSVVKALSWRIVATSTTAGIAYVIIGQAAIAFKIGLIEFFLKIFIYYAHERAWQLLPRGTILRMIGRREG